MGQGSQEALYEEGDWEYRLEDDGTATITEWLGDIYDERGVDACVPDRLGGHVVGRLEGDVFHEQDIAVLVDDGWLPSMYVTSRPDSPARIWCARHVGDYLHWDKPDGWQEPVCRWTALADGSAQIDAWWPGDGVCEVPSTIDGRPVSTLGEGALLHLELAALRLPEGVMRLGEYALAGCLDLERIELPHSLRSVGEGAFSNCSSLEEVAIPDGAEELGAYAFANCSSLRVVTLPQTLRTIGRMAFDSCFDLESVTLPQGLARLESWAFSWCTSLAELDLPEGLQEIGPYAFSFTAIEKLRLPSSVSAIDEHAFCECHAKVEAVPGSYAARWLELNADKVGCRLL